MSRVPETSIIVRVAGDLRFADEALRSAAGQQKWPLDALEIVALAEALDPASLERLQAMVAALDAPSARVVDAGEATGAAAWSIGIEASRGDVVALLEGQDRFHPERLFRMREAAPDAGDWIACSALRFIDPLGDAARDDAPLAAAHRRALHDASRFPSVGFALLRRNLAQTAGNLVFTRSLHSAVGGFDPGDDDFAWGLMLAALERVEPILLPDLLLERRDLGRRGREGDARPWNDREERAAARASRLRLEAWLNRVRDRAPGNPLAPCAEHWPVYFDLFVSRADRLEDDDANAREVEWSPPVRTDDVRWQSWADLVEDDAVEGRDFAVSPDVSPAERAAIAIAQAVIRAQRSAHPDERLALARGLEQVYAGRVHPKGRIRATTPWPAPDATGSREDERIELARSEHAREPRGLRALGPVRWLAALRRHLHFRRMIRDSGLFDVGGYRAQARERGLVVIDPISHYLRRAESHLLDPHPLFHTRYYLERNPDVRDRVNPLLHYLLAGDAEGRRPHWLFDPSWYRMRHGDVDEAEHNALAHFVHRGAAEGRRGHPRHDLVAALHRATRRGGRGRWNRFVDETARGAEGANLRIAVREAMAASDAARGRGHTLEDRRRLRAQAERLRRSPLFDAEFHGHWFGSDLERHGDAATRFLEHAAIEGVGFIGLDRVHDELERLTRQFDEPGVRELSLLHKAREPGLDVGGRRARVTLFVSSKGNAFFAEMSRLLAHGFRRAGAEVSIHDETRAVPDRALAPNEHRIVIAPHEYFLLGDGPKRLSREFLETASLWLAEQPGSEFFAMGIWFARFARRVLDVNPLSALAWGALGFDARALPLGYTTGFDDYADALEIEAPHVRRALRPRARAALSADAPLCDRPIDVSFNGVLTDRRERFFARHADVFANLECALFMPSPATPVSVRLASSLSTHDATALSQRSRILLNVHRGETGYFEWHRLVVRGLWQRALVVSEVSMPVPWLVPGEHYVEAKIDELPGRIEWLLRSEEGRAEAERIRSAGFEALRARYPLDGLCAAFLEDDAVFEPGERGEGR